MEYRKGDICSFLLRYQVEKGSEYTHTSIVKPAGSFYIPSDKLDDFYAKYALAVKHGDDLYVTEKHRDISPIVVDLDFRFEKNENLERKITKDDIIDIVRLYTKHIGYFLDVPEYDVYLMQKPMPVIDKNIMKDGIHFVFPGLVTSPSVQYLIRQRVLSECNEIFDRFGLKNAYEDVIDEAVIQRNNWMMFGSRKPNCEKYDITDIIRVHDETFMNVNVDREGPEAVTKYIELLSIRNKYDKSPLKFEAQKVVQEYDNEEKKKKKKKMDTSVLQTSQNTKKNTCENLDIVKKLVDILSPARADKYTDWIRVGWCLRTIDHRLLHEWVIFSKKSSKYNDGECEKLWNYMKEDGLGIGTLHMWAKQDNPEQYKECAKKDLASLIFRSKNETHHDVANVVFCMYKYDFVCVSIKQNYWYEFKNHRWVSCDSGHALRAKISTEVCKEYLNSAAFWNQKGSSEDDEGEQQRCGEIAKKLNGIALKLKQTAYKDNIMKECKELFYVNKFEEKLDSRTHLIGFENGVYDLESMEFREGRPEDYISFTTNIEYDAYNPNNPVAKEVEGFLSTVYTKRHMKEYVLTLLASFLNGGVKEERFHIWTGTGCFAKGTKVMMYDGTTKNIEDITEGELLMGDDSTPRKVQELFRGYSDMYDIIPVKGESFRVNGDHDLIVKTGNYFTVKPREYGHYRAAWVEHDDKKIMRNVSRSVPTKEEAIEILSHAQQNAKSVKKDEIVKMTVHQYLALPKSIKELLSVYRPDFVQFESKAVDLDPYFLGVWLGDGNLHDTAYTNADIEVVQEMEKICADNGCKTKIYDDKGAAKTYGISGIVRRDNKIKRALQKYKLIKNEKRIPEDYKVNSKEVRMQVLAGLIDTDGHYQPRSKQIEITLASERLIDDTIWIARSLGMSCYKSKIFKKCCNNGKVGTYYQTCIVGETIHEIPVRIPRKKPTTRSCPRDPLKLSFKVKRVQDDDFYGFELDGNRRFLLGNFIVQKNSNGKSKVIDLFEQSFGEYCCKLPITLLTQKRAASNAATSELARTKGKRFACLQEPSEDEKLNVGLMKELTGGDKIMARLIYKEPIEFKPQFKMILTCNNLPNVPSDDGGTWRRIRVVEFTSRFCDNPDPDRENEFLIDPELSDKFHHWKEYFMSLLIEYYKKYMETGITEPDEVLQCTKEYQKNNDTFLEFVEQECERSDEDFVSYVDIYAAFRLWCKENNMQVICSKKRDFIKSISKILGRNVMINKLEGWKGWRFKSNGGDMIDVLDQ